MDNTVWNRLSAEARTEVDGLVAAGLTIPAIVAMLERADPPRPDLRECVDLLAWRHRALQE